MIKHIQLLPAKTVQSELKIQHVGDNFPRAAAEEARKMHHGLYFCETEGAVSCFENIYGQCTAEETEALRDEGIDVFALPELPKDHNADKN